MSGNGGTRDDPISIVDTDEEIIQETHDSLYLADEEDKSGYYRPAKKKKRTLSLSRIRPYPAPSPRKAKVLPTAIACECQVFYWTTNIMYDHINSCRSPHPPSIP